MKPTFRLFLVLALFAGAGCREVKKTEAAEIPSPQREPLPVLEGASIEALDESLWTILPKDATIEVIAEGHDWTEGPLWIAEQERLLYSDIPRNAIYSWKEGEAASLYLQPSGFLGEHFTGEEPGSNGLLLNARGELVLCQHGERRIALMQGAVTRPRPEYIPLADNYNGKRLNSPNDAVYRSNGDLYFTDPPYGLPGLMEDPEKELAFQGVFKLDANGMVTLLTSEFSRPNGIAFSPDEKKLYIANSDPEQAIWKVFDVNEDGRLGAGKVVYDATSLVASEKGLPDGLKVSDDGNLFATGPGGLFIFSPEGKLLGKIKTGQATSNCAFNMDQSVLFITADSYVLRVRLAR